MAKINFVNDPRFMPYFEYYKEQNKSMTPESKTRIKMLLFCGVIFVVLAVLIIAMIKY